MAVISELIRGEADGSISFGDYTLSEKAKMPFQHQNGRYKVKTYKDITYHDLRITNGEQNINVIFDLVIPHRYDNEQIKDIIYNVKNSIKSINNKYSVVIKIDRPFI